MRVLGAAVANLDALSPAPGQAASNANVKKTSKRSGSRDVKVLQEVELNPLSGRRHDHPDAFRVRWRDAGVVGGRDYQVVLRKWYSMRISF